jgi:hypothetical protein
MILPVVPEGATFSEQNFRTADLFAAEDAVHMAHDALRPRHSVGDNGLRSRTDTVPLKVLFPELLHDENPGDDCDDALSAFVHPRKCISFALCSPLNIIIDYTRL